MFVKSWKQETKEAAKVGTLNDGEHSVATNSQMEPRYFGCVTC